MKTSPLAWLPRPRHQALNRLRFLPALPPSESVSAQGASGLCVLPSPQYSGHGEETPPPPPPPRRTEVLTPLAAKCVGCWRLTLESLSQKCSQPESCLVQGHVPFLGTAIAHYWSRLGTTLKGQPCPELLVQSAEPHVVSTGLFNASFSPGKCLQWDLCLRAGFQESCVPISMPEALLRTPAGSHLSGRPFLASLL